MGIMKKRDPVYVLIMCIITGGIYCLYWLLDAKNVLNEKTHTKVPTLWLFTLPFICWIIAGLTSLGVAIFYFLVNGWAPVIPNSSIDKVYNQIELIVALAGLAAVAASVFWLSRFRQAIDEYTQRKSGIGLFLVLLLLNPIGDAYLQGLFNRSLRSEISIPPMAPPAAPSQS